MARNERAEERAMVEADQRRLERARKELRRKSKKSAGDRQIAEQLENVSGTADLDDPQRYNGS
jgi:hypothetical protein